MKILAFIELKEGRPLGSSLELAAAAESLGTVADAVLVVKASEDAAAETAKYGFGKVKVAGFDEVLTEDMAAELIAAEAEKGEYDLVLASATVTGKALIPRVAAKLDIGCVSDVTAVESANGGFVFTRPAFGGTIYEKRTVSGKAAASVRAGSFEKQESGATAVVEETTFPDNDGKLRTRIADVIEETSKAVDIEAAKVVVGCGRGLSTESDFELVQQLADAFGAVIGGSRPVIEAGLLPRQQQIGQSGKIVNPDLYIAVGVSGAPQHIAGISGSKYIVAINRDEDAPIFGVADVGIVGDAKAVIPELIKAYQNHIAE